MQARLGSVSQAEQLKMNEGIDLPEAISNAFSYAIREALLYVGQTAPNPPVGCVILDQQGKILATAAHHEAGKLHAEALALRQCRVAGVWDKIHDVIVTLEPCNHIGRTPPCSESLLRTPARRIWVGVADPNPNVCGAGNERLRQGGKEVFLLRDLCGKKSLYWQKKCEDLIAPFIQSVTRGKAWITVKQALDVAGSMIPPIGKKTFTSFTSLCQAHQLRRGTEAIITGVNTIKEDNPSFTVRYVPDHPGRKRLLIICTKQQKPLEEIVPVNYIKNAEKNNFSLVTCSKIDDLPYLLHNHNILWGMVEGGPQLLQVIRQKKLWDEWLIFRKQNKGDDQLKLISNHLASPTRLLLSHFNFVDFSKRKEGTLCSLVS